MGPHDRIRKGFDRGPRGSLGLGPGGLFVREPPTNPTLSSKCGPFHIHIAASPGDGVQDDGGGTHTKGERLSQKGWNSLEPVTTARG